MKETLLNTVKYSFPKSLRVLRKKNFRMIEKFGEEKIGNFIKMRCHRGFPQRQLGITVSKKFGKAYLRNRFKRTVREAFRLSQHKLPSSLQLNVLPLGKAKLATVDEIKEDLLALTDAPLNNR